MGGCEKIHSPFRGEAKILEQPDYKACIVKWGLGKRFSHTVFFFGRKIPRNRFGGGGANIFV